MSPSDALQFVSPDDPILREIMPEVRVPKEMRLYARAMWQLMRAGRDGYEVGAGIAAPQVGLRARMFVLHLRCTTQPFDRAMVCINPSFTVDATDPQTQERVEGCLTWPGKRIKVKRPEHIHAAWTNATGKRMREELFGWPARCFQHESDHMDGKCLW